MNCSGMLVTVVAFYFYFINCTGMVAESMAMLPELPNCPSSLAAQVRNVGIPGQFIIEYYPEILSRRCDSKFVSMGDLVRLCVICATGLYKQKLRFCCIQQRTNNVKPCGEASNGVAKGSAYLRRVGGRAVERSIIRKFLVVYRHGQDRTHCPSGQDKEQ